VLTREREVIERGIVSKDEAVELHQLRVPPYLHLLYWLVRFWLDISPGFIGCLYVYLFCRVESEADESANAVFKERRDCLERSIPGLHSYLHRNGRK
jgi:hypothetical protein